MQAVANAARPVLRAEGLVKRFGAFTAVDGLSLEVREGEVFGFLGPNGAGKTTSIGMICGLLAADAGRTLVFGEPVAGGAAAVRARVGVCPQQLVLWPRLTCIEQLEFMASMYDVPRAIGRERAVALLRAIGLEDKRDALAQSLSGGMQRRLSVVMALVHAPDIVVLDEPEAGLDPQSRVLVRDYVDDLARKQGKTVIFTTHNMDEAERVVDRVAIIDHGKLLELDTPAALKRRVGHGDTLEIGLGGPLSEERLARLRERVPGAVLSPDGLVLRERGAVERLPAVLEAVRACGLSAGRLHLRESTLEDVFIALTGRRLRE